MSSEFKEITIENFAKGAAVELFERELAQVMKNIDDVNTKPDAQREITLKFIIKPDEHRDQAGLAVEAKSKLAPVKTAVGVAHIGRRNGKLTAYAHDINQMELDMNGPELVKEERGQA